MLPSLLPSGPAIEAGDQCLSRSKLLLVQVQETWRNPNRIGERENKRMMES